ncbi:uncharacterized protein LOC136749908 isoform X2 [Amia ocellicauda]|uniref:uncharacterized protein LOC136749908 isoform X2 n=1 Tax=Amia ocellicauda TaxID=2972642 RepID=UPI00346466B3
MWTVSFTRPLFVIRCPFQHRDQSKQSTVICPDWQIRKQCRNKQCKKKHLDEEALKKFFRCPIEKKSAACSKLNCPNYHARQRMEVVEQTEYVRGPDPVPMKEKRLWNKKKFVKSDNSRTQKLINSSCQFIKVALKYISSAVNEQRLSISKGKSYIKEILHTIFFLGHIDMPSIEPNEVLSSELFSRVTTKYQDVLQKYKTHLPRRPPYSVLLDVVVESTGDANVEAVLDQLTDLNQKMFIPFSENEWCGNDFFLNSTVVSFCYFSDFVTSKRTRNYFGGSVSCKGILQREVFIDISCIATWNKAVSLAVCLAGIHKHKPMLFPPYVHSTAYHMIIGNVGCSGSEEHQSTKVNTSLAAAAGNTGTALAGDGWIKGYYSKPPCQKCLELFPDTRFTPECSEHRYPAPWEYGNCAECEAVSKLLNAETELNKRISLPIPNRISIDSRYNHLLINTFNTDILILQRQCRLQDNLRKTKFEVGAKILFYDPCIDDSTALVPAQ